jgi:hypothetical protein
MTNKFAEAALVLESEVGQPVCAVKLSPADAQMHRVRLGNVPGKYVDPDYMPERAAANHQGC